MHAIAVEALKLSILVIILATTRMTAGLFAYCALNIEAYPDPEVGLPYVQAARTIFVVGATLIVPLLFGAVPPETP